MESKTVIFGQGDVKDRRPNLPPKFRRLFSCLTLALTRHADTSKTFLMAHIRHIPSDVISWKPYIDKLFLFGDQCSVTPLMFSHVLSWAGIDNNGEVVDGFKLALLCTGG